jgi:predicted nucleotidyltransferase
VSPAPTVRFRNLLERLVEHDVEFVIVGGLAGVLHGSPINTQDLDIIYKISEINIENLLRALSSVDAFFRTDPRKLRPDASHLASRGHKLLETCFGPLDCLGTIEEDTAYEDLLEHLELMDLDGLVVQVISLPRLIQVKEKLTRPKDKIALDQLRATLIERTKSNR